MALDYIREKAKQLGLDPGSSSNHEDNLRTIASQLGLDYDLTDLSEIESILDEMLIIKQREDNLNNLVDGIEELLDEPLVEEVIEEEQDNYNRGNESEDSIEDEETTEDESGENNESTEGDSNSSESKTQNKETEENKESSESSDADSKTDTNNQSANETEPSSKPGKDVDIPNKEEGLPETKGQKNWDDKPKATKETVQKNPNNLQNKFNNVQNKMQNLKNSGSNLKQGLGDAAKNLGGKALDAGKTAGKAVGDGAKAAGQAVGKAVSAGAQKLVTLIVTHPEVAAIVAAIILVIFIIFLLFMAFSDTNESEALGYYDSSCDFNQTTVVYTNSDGNVTNLELEEFVKGSAYVFTKDKELTTNQLKALMITIKTNALSLGNYSNSNKSVSLNNSTLSYENYGDMQEELDTAYSDISGYLYLPNTYVDTITSLTSATVLDININSFISTTGSYESILSTIYNDETLTIYDLSENCTYYVASGSDTYWWPIGSKETEEINGKLFAKGTPASVNISSHYGNRWGRNHNGLDITAYRNANIIASKAGEVIAVVDGYGEGSTSSRDEYINKANYVKIKHDDGSETRYWHLEKGTITVSVGERVEQGQVIGGMGNSGYSTGVHLHYELRINGDPVDPLDYIDLDNPRAVSIEGSSNQQTVCKVLLSKGFSKDATAAIMVNIQAESSFNPENEYMESDGYISYGLCQWHKGRLDNLKKYRPDTYKTIPGQIDYLKYELNNTRTGALPYLQGDYTVSEMATQFCILFETPYDYNNTCPKRASNYAATMTSYVNNGCQ